MLMELLAAEPDYLVGQWIPCPDVSARDKWETLPGRKRWIYFGGKYAKRDVAVSPLSLNLWLMFTKCGNRVEYEHIYFSRRRKLSCLIMAECMENNGKYLTQISDLVWALSEESAWQLPVHNVYYRDSEPLPIPDVDNPVVDLFAAETGSLLSMVHYLLGDALDSIAPGLDARIVREVEKRVLQPWLTQHFWWMGNGDEPMCNWTTWCTQNCLIAAALLHQGDIGYIRTCVKQAAYSLDCFLKDYGEDGCCSEGPQYYHHAALTLYNSLEILCALAPGVFDKVWHEPKIRNIAEYIVYVHVSGMYYLNFGDCSPKAGQCGVREYLFGKRVKSSLLMTLAASDFAADKDPDHIFSKDDSEGINLFYLVQTAFAEEEVHTFSKISTDCIPKNVWYPSVGMCIRRTGSYIVGIKAGNNFGSHKHNDTGSMILYKDKKPLLVDIGVETYSKKTFSSRRYEIWTMQSSWHNLPQFVGNGCVYDQQYGPACMARDVQLLQNGLSMDIAPAYGNVPGLGYYRRKVMVSDSGMILDDKTDYRGDVCMMMISEQKPYVNNSIIQFGGLAEARLDGKICDVKMESVSITDPRLRQSWPDKLYRTVVRFRDCLKICIA